MKSAHYLVGLMSAVAMAECKGTVTWGECDPEFQSDNWPLECGTLQVPLDYTDPSSNRTIELKLLRALAAEQPSKGSVLTNFGGPGVVGRANLAMVPDIYVDIMGGHYDVVAFDPRGTGDTIPFTCFESAEARQAAIIQAPEVWHKVLTQMTVFSNGSDAGLGEVFAGGAIIAEQCYQHHQDTGSYVGTAFTARDMIEIVDAIEEDGLLRFWGGSYGTTLGAVTAAMFPDRIDRMVIDAVLNPMEYYSEFRAEQLSDSDMTFSYVFQACVESPDHCVLARNNATAEDLEAQTWALLDSIKYNPIPVDGILINYNYVKSGILTCLYSPASWRWLAHGIDFLQQGNYAAFKELWDGIVGSYTGGVDNMAVVGIWCADRVPRFDNFEDFLPHVMQQFETTRIMGDTYTSIDATCAHWKFEAKERYLGDYNAPTRHPVLVVGNTGDAMTPLVSARNVTDILGNAVLLQNDGYGHGSNAHPSLCAIQIVKDYFNDGAVPEDGTICTPETPAFEVGADTGAGGEAARRLRMK